MHRRRTIVGILLTLLFAADVPVFGGPNRWTSNGPEGASITSLVIDFEDPRIVYAATEGGLFRSTTGGEPHWEEFNANLPEFVITAMVMEPGPPAVMYAGTNHGHVFRSTNRGQSWSQLSKPTGGSIRAFAIDAPRRRIYAATATGVWLSHDDGETWRAVLELYWDARTIAVSPRGTVYAAMQTGYSFHTSRDGGETWTTSGEIVFVSAISHDPHRSMVYVTQMGNGGFGVQKIWVSSDEGQTWGGMPHLTPYVAQFVPTEAGLFAATAEGVHVFDHATRAWRKLGAFARAATTLALEAPSQTSPRRLYAGSRSGVYVAVDEALVWTPATIGMNAAFSTDLVTSGESSAIVVTPGGPFRTADAGESWVKAGALDEPLESIAMNARGTIYVSGQKGIKRSSDRGDSWSVVTPRVPTALATARESSSTLYAAFTEAISKSTDDGQSWQAVQTGLEFSPWWFYYGLSATLLETDVAEPATAYVATDVGLFRTGNSGATWTKLFEGYIPALAGRGGIIHAAAGLGLTTSLDGGLRWQSRVLMDERVQAIAIDPSNPARSYAGTFSGRVYRTDDSGNTWILFSEGLRGAPVHRLEITASGGEIYAATSGGVFVYQIVPALPGERLAEDPLRLPRLMRQILANVPATNERVSALVLPAAGTVVGSRGNVFRTDVTLANNRASHQDVMVAWLPQGNTKGAAVPMFRIGLPAASGDAGGILTIADVADALGVEGLGALVIIATNEAGDSDPSGDISGFARVRSDSPCGSGSVSQSLPAVSAQAFAPHRRGRALGLRHESGYRTNVGIVNLSEVSREFTVVVDGQRHLERFTLSVPPFSPMQTAIPEADYGAVAVTIVRHGQPDAWAAYASSVDNASGDAWASLVRAGGN